MPEGSVQTEVTEWLEKAQSSLRELIDEMTTLVVHGAKADPRYVGSQIVSAHNALVETLKLLGVSLPDQASMYPQVLLEPDDDDEYEI